MQYQENKKNKKKDPFIALRATCALITFKAAYLASFTQ
jgi:hypothetical protein